MKIQQAPCQSIRNGIHRCSVQLNSFDAAQNDPCARFDNKVRGHESVDALTEAMTQIFTNLQRGQPHQFMDIACDYDDNSQMLENANS